MEATLSLPDYRALSEFRYQIRKFLHFSQQIAADAGLEPRQHQLLLAVKGLPEGRHPRIADLAERLQIRHHSAVELVNRLATQDYSERHRGGTDRRKILIALTFKGEKILRQLSLHHRAELRTQGPALVAALKHAMHVIQPARTKQKRK